MNCVNLIANCLNQHTWLLIFNDFPKKKLQKRKIFRFQKWNLSILLKRKRHNEMNCVNSTANCLDQHTWLLIFNDFPLEDDLTKVRRNVPAAI